MFDSDSSETPKVFIEEMVFVTELLVPSAGDDEGEEDEDEDGGGMLLQQCPLLPVPQ